MGGLSISGAGSSPAGLSPAEFSKLKRRVKSGGTIEFKFTKLPNNVPSNGGTSGFLANLINTLIKSLKDNQSTDAVQNPATTRSAQATDSGTVDTDAINRTKQALSQELASYKNMGITVSDWDANNSCTLSVNGKTATVTIDNSGKPQFSGDMEVAEYIKANDPNEQASVEKQDAFIQAQQAAGDPVVGDVKSTTVKVGGKDVAVNEYTTQSGKKYYLDRNGNQVTPDVP